MSKFHLLPRYLEVLYPFDHHFCELPTGRLHFIDEGQGRPILFLHGNPTWSFYYRNLIIELKTTHRCIALDHMGCGLSERSKKKPFQLADHIQHTCQLIEQLNLDSFDLVVHDWGGAIGLGVAQHFFDRIEKIALLNTAAFFIPPLPFPIQFARLPLLGSFLTTQLNLFLLGSLLKCTTKKMPKEVQDGYLWPYRKSERRKAIYNFVKDIPLHSSNPSYRVIKSIETFLPQLAEKKLHAFWGMKDFVFTEAYLDAWHDIFPTMAIKRYEDGGHWVLEDAKGKIEKDISLFFKEPNQNI